MTNLKIQMENSEPTINTLKSRTLCGTAEEIYAR